MTRSLALLCGLLIILFPKTAVAQSCPNNAAQEEAKKVRAIRADLLAVQVRNNDRGTGISPATQRAIREFKNEIATTITYYLSCAPKEHLETKNVEGDLARLLDANEAASTEQTSAGGKPDTNSQVNDQIFGADLKVEVTRPDNKPDLIVVKISFDVPCGSDAMLLVYESREGIWQQALRWQSGDYAEIFDAFGDFFEYAVVPHGKTGQWTMAVAHGHPWCTSRWSGFDIDVIAPAKNSNAQRVVFHHEDGYVRDDVSPKKDGFELRLEKGSEDVDLMTRMGIYRYRLEGETFRRVQPIAMNGRDFVDEWLQVDWSDASRWSVEANLASLKKEHERIADLTKSKASTPTMLTYGAVRSCTDEAKHFQVQMNVDPGSPMYFQIKQGENSFTMLSTSLAQDSRCKGPDLMPKRY
jgi:hypothetical protein